MPKANGKPVSASGTNTSHLPNFLRLSRFPPLALRRPHSGSLMFHFHAVAHVRMREIAHFLLRFFFRNSVALLDFSHQLIPLARNHVHIVVGQLAPLLFDLPDRLSPLTFNLIP